MWQKWLEVFGNRLLVVEKTLLSKATTFQRLSDFLRIRGYPKQAKFYRYNSQGNRSSSLCQHVDLVRELKEPRQFRLWQSDTSTPGRSPQKQKQKQKHASGTGTTNIIRQIAQICTRSFSDVHGSVCKRRDSLVCVPPKCHVISFLCRSHPH